MKILHITTVPMSLVFLRGQVGYVKSRGEDVIIVSSPGDELEDFARDESVPVHAIRMSRQITPLKDILALLNIWRVIRRTSPTVVHAHTPKGGLLGTIAAGLSGTPVRVYHMRGLPFVTANGFRRRLLQASEWISCHLAHVVLCNSYSIRDLAVSGKLCPPERIRVLQNGSGNGVDARERFNPLKYSGSECSQIRSSLGIPKDSLVIGFVGRLVKEKGIGELEEAWQYIRSAYPKSHLLIVGPFESQDPVPQNVIGRLETDPRVHLTGVNWNTPPLYASMDLVVLPTYREGFPNVPLEGAAMGLPVIATNVPGCVDAVLDGETGTLIPPRDSQELARAIGSYLDDPALRQRHGEAGRARVLRDYRPESIWEDVFNVYLESSLRTSLRPSKRIFDFAVAAVALILLSPVILISALFVRLLLGTPILFKQERPGYLGRPFTMYKLRTMIGARDKRGDLLDDHLRITRLGRFLRRTSIDELPELWNVLKGDMSLVGPRPLLTEYLELYTPKQFRRHEVRPGLTGWAQIHGRNDTTWERRLALDVWYVDHRSWRLDLKILTRTLLKVVRREGINQEGTATMTPFRGTAT